MATVGDASATSHSTRVEEIGQTVDKLADYYHELTQRITDLEEDVKQLQLKGDNQQTPLLLLL